MEESGALKDWISEEMRDPKEKEKEQDPKEKSRKCFLELAEFREKSFEIKLEEKREFPDERT